jgi:hypothetical protein
MNDKDKVMMTGVLEYYRNLYCRLCSRPMMRNEDTIIIDGEKQHFSCHCDKVKRGSSEQP